MTVVNLVINSAGNDGETRETNAGDKTLDAARVQHYCGTWSNGSTHIKYYNFYRFTGVPSMTGNVIVSSTLSVNVLSGHAATALLSIWADDAASPSAPTSFTNFFAKPRTSASVEWNKAFNTEGWQVSPDIKTVIQELSTSYNPSIIQLLPGPTSSTFRTTSNDARWGVIPYDRDPALAAKLTIEYAPPTETFNETGVPTTFYMNQSGMDHQFFAYHETAGGLFVPAHLAGTDDVIPDTEAPTVGPIIHTPDPVKE